jgi:hypothetical protein
MTFPRTDAALWGRIRAFELDEPEAAYSFSDRLATENGWSAEFSLRAIDEYKRFMYLLCVSGHPCTPSDEVDQVWHLHLVYTRSYWLDFCPNVLQRAMHHGPTQGGETEGDKFTDWYARTKASYQHEFGKAPPEELWPSSEIRFGANTFRRVNTHTHWVVRKPRIHKP